MMEKPWFEKGLSFSCTGCGKCCTGFPGYVWLTKNEPESICSFLQITLEEFLSRYVRRASKGLSLKEMPKTYDCIFFQNNRCTIYSVRPLQCRTYPWWPELVRTRENWENVSKFCEGINHPNASLVSAEEIKKTLEVHMDKFI